MQWSHIMCSEQFNDLLTWLDRYKNSGKPLFICSSSIFLPRRFEVEHISPLRSDGWSGYPGSLHRLLAYIADQQIANIVFLSGDEHLSCIAQVTIGGKKGKAVIHSIHSSALYAPLPFVNTRSDQLLANESFHFNHLQVSNEQNEQRKAKAYQCDVKSVFPSAGDGFTIIRIEERKNEGHSRWLLHCEYDRSVTDGEQLITTEYFLDGQP